MFWGGLTIFLGFVSFGSFLMGMARVEPEQAQTTWTNWIRFVSPFRRYLRWVGLLGLAAAMFLAGAIYGQSTSSENIATLNTEILNGRAESNRAINLVASERNLLSTELEALKAKALAVSVTASPVLGLTDVARWKISNDLREQTKDAQEMQKCSIRVTSKPDSELGAWNESVPLVKAAGWTILGAPSRMPRTAFPDGFTIYTSSNEGLFYNCGWRYAEMLRGLHIDPVSFKSKESSPALTDCHGECIEVVIGETHITK